MSMMVKRLAAHKGDDGGIYEHDGVMEKARELWGEHCP